MGETDGWILLEQINDEELIWAGTKVRVYGLGLNVSDQAEDYNDYLVSYIYDNQEYLQLTNLSAGEAGNIRGVLKKDQPNHYALGKTLKAIMGDKDCYVRWE